MSVELLGRPCRIWEDAWVHTSKQDSCVSASKGIQYSVLVSSFPYRYNIFTLNCWKSARGASWKVPCTHIKGSPNNESSRNSWFLETPGDQGLRIWEYETSYQTNIWENSNIPWEHAPNLQPPVYEGHPEILSYLVFWGTWQLGYVPGVRRNCPRKQHQMDTLVKLAMFF